MSTPFVPETLSDTVLDRYNALLAAGGFESDQAQLAAIARLDALNRDLAERKLANKKSSLGWLFGARSAAWKDVRGLYIWGDVGRGKTMLMDIFFQVSPIRRKRRVHFHEFMGDVHARIHSHRKAVQDGAAKDADPVIPVANAIADEVRLLCFDEFTVRDITDAMIMRRLFTQLFKRNVVIVATSNVEPDDLYRDGLRRSDFLPFIELLKTNVDELRLNARTDFRLEKLGHEPVYSFPADAGATITLERAWQTMTGTTIAAPRDITVQGRILTVPQAVLGVARFSFADLCEKPLGAADYLKLAQTFHTIFVEKIPLLPAEKRNEAKRFINLIDALYDSRVKLVATAAAAPHDLNQGLRDTEAFEFERTISRLIEMQSDAYLAEPHSAQHPADPVAMLRH
ncbi:MAG: AFG1 family ATPase [Rhizobiales bacterium]|nr:AFG1 family ATPase [Hyphomicrobiales bacterium]